MKNAESVLLLRHTEDFQAEAMLDVQCLRKPEKNNLHFDIKKMNMRILLFQIRLQIVKECIIKLFIDNRRAFIRCKSKSS